MKNLKLFQKKQPKLTYFADLGHLYEEKTPRDETDRIPSDLTIRDFDFCCYLFAIFSYVADIGLDISVAYLHFESNRTWSFIFITSFTVFPSLLLNIISFVWWLDDRYSRKLSNPDETSSKFWTQNVYVRIIASIFQIGPLLWYVDAIHNAYKCRYLEARIKDEPDARQKHLQYYCRMIESERDASLLRFFEAFLESLPQLLVQGFLFAQEYWIICAQGSEMPAWMKLQLFSMSFSLLSICSSISIQHRSLRISRQEKMNMKPYESFLQFTWRLCTVSSRYICLIMFLLAFKQWIILVFAFHFLVSLIHISALQSIHTGTSYACMEVGLMVINAFIHTFTPYNMADGSTRWQYVVGYGLEFFENLIMMSLCLLSTKFDYPSKFLIAGIALWLFLMGILIMVLYYSYCHPNRRRNRNFNDRKQEELEEMSIPMTSRTDPNSEMAMSNDHAEHSKELIKQFSV